MKLGKIISLLLVVYFSLKVAEKIMYDMHHYLRYVVIDISYGVLPYQQREQFNYLQDSL